MNAPRHLSAGRHRDVGPALWVAGAVVALLLLALCAIAHLLYTTLETLLDIAVSITTYPGI